MTNKQIIIDGVDVSECEFYNTDDGTCREVNGKYDTDICEFDKCENSNCYFKQLKRKEQALDEIEKYLDAQQKYLDGEDYHNLLDIINKAKENKCI